MSALKKILPKNKIIPIIVAAVFCVLGVIILFVSVEAAKSRCAETFDSIYQNTKQNTYNEIYQSAFDYYEKKNHVSNIASISLGNIQEENDLEVLSVCDSWIKVSPETEDDIRWVEFNATGVYTVDMSRSEFMIDDINNYVYVKLETPKLCHISVDTNPTVFLYKYKNNFWECIVETFTNSNEGGNYDAGVNEYLNDRVEALDKLTEALERNDENLDKAKKSAESLIRTFIKNVNPDLELKDSNILIEFI